VRHRKRQLARHDRQAVLAAEAVRGRLGALRGTVVARGEGDDLELGCRVLGDADRRLDGLGARGEEERLAQRPRQDRGELRGEVHHGRAQQRAVQVVELRDVLGHGRCDLRVAVAQARAHLAGREVDDFAARLVVDVCPLGPA